MATTVSTWKFGSLSKVDALLLFLLLVLIGANAVLTALYGYGSDASGSNKTSARVFFFINLLVFIGVVIYLVAQFLSLKNSRSYELRTVQKNKAQE